jgi:hypothetical protein
VPDYVSAYVDDDDDDPAAIQAQIEDRMATLIPGLVFRPASPMRYLVEALAQEVAETRRAATGEGQTLDRIAQFLAEETFGLPVQAAVPASGALTVTYADTLGHEITAGRQLTLLAGDGTTRVGFEVVETVYVPPGSSSTGAGEVAILALEAGVAGNGLVDEPEFEEIGGGSGGLRGGLAGRGARYRIRLARPGRERDPDDQSFGHGRLVHPKHRGWHVGRDPVERVGGRDPDGAGGFVGGRRGRREGVGRAAPGAGNGRVCERVGGDERRRAECDA